SAALREETTADAASDAHICAPSKRAVYKERNERRMTRFSRTLSTFALASTLLAMAAAGVFAQATRPSTGPEVIVPNNKNPNQLISFSFYQADIDDVLRFLAEASG